LDITKSLMAVDRTELENKGLRGRRYEGGIC
jgi:hypothetical protein